MPDNVNKSSGNYSSPDIIAFIIIGLTILALFFVSSAFVYQLFFKKPRVQQIVISVAPKDSLDQSLSYSSMQIDSLVNVIKHHEQALEEKYQYVIEEKEEKDSLNTLGTLIVGIVLSFCGFFGYKSFTDLKSHGEKIASNAAIEVAEKVAQTEAEKSIDNKVKSYLNENLSNEVNANITDYYRSQTDNVLANQIKDSLRQELQSYIDNAVDRESIIRDILAQQRTGHSTVETHDREDRQQTSDEELLG